VLFITSPASGKSKTSILGEFIDVKKSKTLKSIAGTIKSPNSVYFI
jgi:hypothetical protein